MKRNRNKLIKGGKKEKIDETGMMANEIKVKEKENHT